MVLFRSQFRQDFEQIQRELETMYNPHIQKQLTYPVVDVLSLHFTYLFLTSLGFSKEMRHLYSVSQCLIQLGLDSHDQVQVEEEVCKEGVTKQQLTVLSGDLFSGYYYYYLAQKNEIELIRRWSLVIQDINIQKTDVHLARKKFPQPEVESRLNELKKNLTKAVFSWFNAPAYWLEIFTLAGEMEIAVANPAVESTLKEQASIYQEKIEQLSEGWLRDELSLWLDRVPKTDLVLGS